MKKNRKATEKTSDDREVDSVDSRDDDSAPPAPRSDDAEGRRASRMTTGIAVGALVLLAGAALVLGANSGGKDKQGAAATGAWRGKVARSAGASDGLKACDPSGSACRGLREGAEIPAGSILKTDYRTRAELVMQDGSRLLLDRGTELSMLGDGQRRAKLQHGAVLAEITEHKGDQARVDLPNGSVRVTGTKLAVRADGPRAGVDVLRGSVALENGSGESVMVRAGETGRLLEGSPPAVAATPSLADAMAWGEDAFGGSAEAREVHRGLGELIAKKPGENNERRGAVTLTSHGVRVRIAGAVARTEVEEVFSNQTDQVLEGIFRFPLPADAQIERLALDVDGKLEEGAFVDRDRAAAIWRGAIVNAAPQQPKPREEIVWVPGPWRDPALLEWQRGGRFELRIFPIPKRGSRRVIIAYTQAIPAAAGVRHFAYPLAYDPSGTTRVADFHVDVEVRGHDPKLGVRARGYELSSAERGDATSLNFSQRDFAPSGDLEIEYLLPDRDRELSVFSYEEGAAAAEGELRPVAIKSRELAQEPAGVGVDDRPFVAVALRPKLPRAARDTGQALALVVDASRSMYGESYRRATELAAKVARELEPTTRLFVLSCDTECTPLAGGSLQPGAGAAEQVSRFFAGIKPEGASDVVAAVRAGYDAMSREQGRALRVVYLGDGAPTVGPIRPGTVQRAVARFADRSRVSITTVGVGTESDSVTLRAVARGGGGVSVPYAPGRTVSEIAYSVLGAVSGSVLSDVSVELPQGLSAMAPVELDSMPSGSETWITARLGAPQAKGDLILRGRVGSDKFEQRYQIDVSPSRAKGNAFVPRLYAAARISDLERDGAADAKKEAIALSRRFSVASRYTSLLVLESSAMFKAFGLDNTRRADQWSGEEEADGDATSGLFDVGADEEADLASAGSIGTEGKSDGAGSLGFGSGEGRLASKPAPAPAPKKASKAPMDAFEGPASAPAAASPRAEAAPPPAATSTAPQRKPAVLADDRNAWEIMERDRLARERSRRRMVPMRRTWERVGEIFIDRFTPKAASFDALSNAERLTSGDTPKREDVKKLYALLMQSGDIERAGRVAERWSDKEPLDPEALTARADIEGRRGQRALALRILGSVVDVRPSDVAAHKRLARLLRWSGRAELGCRHSVGVAELKPADAELLAEAVRCSREGNERELGDALLANAESSVRKRAEALLAAARADDSLLTGDIKLEASWDSGVDLDLSLIDAEGHRISWLGAPTKAVIAARDVISLNHEGLSLRGGKPGEYVVEIARASGLGSARGDLTITAAGTTRRVPFSLSSDRATLALVKISTREKLVPLGWR